MTRVKYCIALLALLAATGLRAQTMAGLEYWFDGDRSGLVQVETTETNVSIEADVSGLPPGFHVLCLRARDSEGRWGVMTTQAFVKPTIDAYRAQDLVCDYWFDGNESGRVSVSFASGDLLTVEAPTSSLSTGMHTLCYTLRDATGTFCGPTYTQNFVRLPAYSLSEGTLECRYWFDGDLANGGSSPVGTDSAAVIAADVSSLSQGFHTLCYGLGSADGLPGSVYTQNFIRIPAFLPDPSELKCRYWFDGDEPGGKTASVGADGTFSADADVASLSPGLHTLFCRLVGTDGMMGPVSTNCFVRALSDATAGDGTVEYQYWFDTDTTTAAIYTGSAAGGVIDVDFTTSQLKPGGHLLCMRTRTPGGSYGPVLTQWFIVPHDVLVASPVVACRYWFDNNETAADTLEVEGANPLVLTDFELDVPADMPFPDNLPADTYVTPLITADGTSAAGMSLNSDTLRCLHLQFMSADSVWSEVSTDEFTYQNKLDYAEVPSVGGNRVSRVEQPKAGIFPLRVLNMETEATIGLKTDTDCALALLTDTGRVADIAATELTEGRLLTLPAGRYYAVLHRGGLPAGTADSLRLVCADSPLPQPLDMAEAGTLGELLSFTDKSAVESFALTGSIGAADFEALAGMPQLRVLDIAGSSLPGGTLADGMVNALPAIEEVSLPSSMTTASDGALSGTADRLLVVRWNSTSAPVSATAFDAPDTHANLMVYAPEGTTADYGGNVIIGGRAAQVTLYDGHPVRIPEAFEAASVVYRRDFDKSTVKGESAGWETIVLPFDVQTVTASDGRSLAPFGSEAANDGTARPFWLDATAPAASRLPRPSRPAHLI